jgi:undecaprenyl-diphosphatase
MQYGTPELEIIIQLGAMLALTWCTRDRLIDLAAGLRRRTAARLFFVKLGIAFLPAAIVGFLCHDLIEGYLFRPDFVAGMLVAGGVLILLLDGPGRGGGIDELESLTFRQAMAIGIGQTASLLPGVSRSGATIVTGLVAGLSRRAATEFSFVLALPTMYAACLYTMWKARERLTDELGLAMVVGLLAAYVSSVVVIHAFLRYVQSSSLGLFLLAVFAWG